MKYHRNKGLAKDTQPTPEVPARSTVRRSERNQCPRGFTQPPHAPNDPFRYLEALNDPFSAFNAPNGSFRYSSALNGSFRALNAPQEALIRRDRRRDDGGRSPRGRLPRRRRR
ncbi:hypothetical protein GCM10022247_12410 [Allokutzneria multivorans]|uniref:Uncharacterized protein n=1 Tax=Allokutzneria multivorans TaxID=1142134 RepID=A0ABP7R8X1_9PSEU